MNESKPTTSEGASVTEQEKIGGEWDALRDTLIRSGQFAGGGCGPAMEWMHERLLAIETTIRLSTNHKLPADEAARAKRN